MKNTVDCFIEENIDIDYSRFSSSLAMSKLPLVGIRIPLLKAFARQCAKKHFSAFISSLEFTTFEGVMLYGLAAAYAPIDINEKIRHLNIFLTHADSWSHTDTVSSACTFFKKSGEELLPQIRHWLVSEDEFTSRFALVLLRAHYVEEKYLDFIFSSCALADNKKYYVSMASAWLLCDCIIKFKERTVSFLQTNSIDEVTLSRTVKKATESLRVDDELKNYLRQKFNYPRKTHKN